MLGKNLVKKINQLFPTFVAYENTTHFCFPFVYSNHRDYPVFSLVRIFKFYVFFSLQDNGLPQVGDSG